MEKIERHAQWLAEGSDVSSSKRANFSEMDLSNVSLCGVNLSGALLSKVNLSGANLYGANFSGAELYGAVLSHANLTEADFSNAYLVDANLIEANLCRANLCNANLSGANLYRAQATVANFYSAILNSANLSKTRLYGSTFIESKLYMASLCNADLHCADFIGADLSYADFSGADFFKVNLSGAKICSAKIDAECLDSVIPISCPDSGSFIAWKYANGFIVKLEVLSDAKRCSSLGRKCRCSAVKCLAIENLDGTNANVICVSSSFDNSFMYTVGEVSVVADFNSDRRVECAPGIHFFITRQEAVDYGVDHFAVRRDK